MNCLVQIVHVPTVSQLVRDMIDSNGDGIAPNNEALMFAIYYAAITSMEEEDVSSYISSSSLFFREARPGLADHISFRSSRILELPRQTSV